MKITVAREYANALLAACNRAEKEGRDALTKDDIDTFSALDDAARADLQAAIDASQ